MILSHLVEQQTIDSYIQENMTHALTCSLNGSTYTKIGTIQRRLAWPLRKDDTQIREAFQIFYRVLFRLALVSDEKRQIKLKKREKIL